MTYGFAVGDSVAGEKLYYIFGRVPSARLDGRRYFATLMLTGDVVVIEPLRTYPAGGAPHIQAIRCKSARVECDDRPKFPGTPTTKGSNHTRWYGTIQGNARGTIKIPIRSRTG